MKRWLIQHFFNLTETVSHWQTRAVRPVTPARVLVLTAYTPDIREYGVISAENKARYARVHGYGCRVCTSGFIADRPAAWSKLRFILDGLKTHELVFWTDADALVMNPFISLESLLPEAYDIHLTRTTVPYEHVNTGNMLFRSTPFARTFLHCAWRLKAFTHKASWEQLAINHLVQTFRFRRLLLSPNRRFNSFVQVTGDPDPYQTGDFVVHFPGVPDKYLLLADYAEVAERRRIIQTGAASVG